MFDNKLRPYEVNSDFFTYSQSSNLSSRFCGHFLKIWCIDKDLNIWPWQREFLFNLGIFLNIKLIVCNISNTMDCSCFLRSEHPHTPQISTKVGFTNEPILTHVACMKKPSFIYTGKKSFITKSPNLALPTKTKVIFSEYKEDKTALFTYKYR